jgi:glycosyltransferase involved in cell wall biosynthesis
VSVVSVHYEPEIWGGEDGSHILDFVRALRVPFVVTLHSVQSEPTAAQRHILTELVDTAQATVVMSQVAAQLLTQICGVDISRIDVVPHGVPDLPLVAPDTIKPRLGLQGKAIVLSFGLLAPGKGFETVIEAMPAVVEAVPSARYIILGVTSPESVGREGESYRATLEARVAALGLTEQIKFVDRFVGRVELGTWLEAADVFVSPSPNLRRTVSGAIAYAMGAGKAIVSAPSAYAGEMLADGRGRLVPAGDSAAFAGAISELLLYADLRASMGKLAHEHSRPAVWWEVGARYRQIFDRAARDYRAIPIVTGRHFTAVVA